MSRADFDVTLLGGEPTAVSRQYLPGAKLQGRLTLFIDENIKCNHLYARLGWHTEGRGSRHAETITEIDLFQGELQASLPQTFDYAFTLPGQPWSYEGHYINIVWAITFVIDVPWGRDIQHQEPFILSPQRIGG